jgi:predicted transcriptional regulator
MAQAFDSNDFVQSLEDLSDGISQTAYSISEDAESNERAVFEETANRTDKAEVKIKGIINKIEKEEDFNLAFSLLADFAAKNKLNEHTAAFVSNLLNDRKSFVFSSQGNTEAQSSHNISFKSATDPEMLLSTRQRRLIMLDTPIAEATISVEDTKNNRRVGNLKEIFNRHECRILSEHQEDGKDNKINNYYFSGKKFVVDALLGHFGGEVIKSDLKAIVKITTGGFWSGKTSAEFVVGVRRNNSVMGDLSWYKSTVEKDPFKYFASNGQYIKLTQLGKLENVAGEKKLQLKNAIVEIWVTPGKGTKRNAIYFKEIEFGDVYMDAQ